MNKQPRIKIVFNKLFVKINVPPKTISLQNKRLAAGI